jgi:hypothetical protein
MLIGIAFLSSTLNMKIRAKLNKLIPILVILIGLLFILRGLNLGIPYISPKDQVLSPQENVDGESSEHSCH